MVTPSWATGAPMAFRSPPFCASAALAWAALRASSSFQASRTLALISARGGMATGRSSCTRNTTKASWAWRILETWPTSMRKAAAMTFWLPGRPSMGAGLSMERGWLVCTFRPRLRAAAARLAAVAGLLAQLLELVLGLGGEAFPGELGAQLLLDLLEGLLPAPLVADEVDAVDGAHRLADLADLEGLQRLHEGLLHLAGLEPAQVALVALGAGVLAERLGGLVEVLAGNQLGPQVQGLLHGLRHLGVGFGLEQDVAGLQLDELALARIVDGLDGRVVGGLDAHGGRGDGHVVDHPARAGLEARSGFLQEGLQLRRRRDPAPALGSGARVAASKLIFSPRTRFSRASHASSTGTWAQACSNSFCPVRAEAVSSLQLLEAHAVLAEGVVDLGAGPELAVSARRSRSRRSLASRASAHFRVGDDDAVAIGQFLDQLVAAPAWSPPGSAGRGPAGLDVGVLAQAPHHVPAWARPGPGA